MTLPLLIKLSYLQVLHVYSKTACFQNQSFPMFFSFVKHQVTDLLTFPLSYSGARRLWPRSSHTWLYIRVQVYSQPDGGAGAGHLWEIPNAPVSWTNLLISTSSSLESPYLGKARAPTRAPLPIPINVWSIFMCPKISIDASVWNFWLVHRCWCMRLRMRTVQIL